MSGIVHPAQASHSSPPSNSARSRLHLPASKLVRRARESRYLGGGFGGGGGGGAIEFGFESSLEESPRLSFTTLSESDQSSAQDPGWYKAHYPTSGLEVQTYARDMPYFLSFAASSADWDSLMTSALEGCAAYSTANARIDSAGNEVVRAPPRRVLDVGCGSGHWMLGQAFVRGWEETEFVGLDAAPSRFDGGVLPPSLSGRVSHVQHDFLRGPLPFLDNHFDFVRIARMNVAIPEIKWMELLEECVRVLTPGSYFEVAEVDFAIYKRHEQVQRIFDSVFDHQFLNSRPLTVIPSNLTLVARDMRSTGRIATRLPSGPSFSEDRHCTDSEPILSANLPPLRKFAAGSDPTLDTPRSSIMSHLALHSYAGHLASSSWGIANAALEARDAGRASSEEDGSGRNMTTSRRERELGHVMDAVENYADELKDRAGIAQLVTARLGWDPTFDKKLERQLHDNLPILEDRVRLFAVERRNGDAAFGGQQDPEIEFRYQQAELARKESQHDIQQVRHRLEGMHDENEQDLELGSMDLEVFVARAP